MNIFPLKRYFDMTRHLVYGVGINDADYVVQLRTKYDKTLHCPFYTTWVGVLRRCYSENWKIKYPTYKECTIDPEWHRFSVFRAWMQDQDWQDKVLDKDILIVGNKVYSPSTCVFITSRVNKFCNENSLVRGECPIGVSRYEHGFHARAKDVLTNKLKYLGTYANAEEAHEVWVSFKLKQARILASEQTDERVAKALIDRYENYKET